MSDASLIKLNPDYDSTKDYVSREDRKEWDTVGLVGKLRDISDSVEEWLVR